VNRREFLQISAAAAALAAGGRLPLLAQAAGGKNRPGKRAAGKRAAGKGAASAAGRQNIFTEPPAIEPVTGYLPKFTPAGGGSMRGAFVATYTLVQFHGSETASGYSLSGSLELSQAQGSCKVRERRVNRPSGVVEIAIQCGGELSTVTKWTLKSSVEGVAEAGFAEAGAWDGKAMTVRSDSWTQRRETTLPLIARWSLPGLLAGGKVKQKPLRFDLLDGSTLRAEQTLRHCGQVEVPTAAGAVTLDCYAQTGRAVLPTHYLVDTSGRVQLITQESVNWALATLK